NPKRCRATPLQKGYWQGPLCCNLNMLAQRGVTLMFQGRWRNLLRRWFPAPGGRGRPARRRRLSVSLEPLEERVLLDGGLAPALIVGRTLSAYTMPDVQNNQLTITYTVYNEQADPETGVLLTDTLQPGVTFVSASQLPDQSGQQLAWSLGTIQGFDRAS